MTIYSGYAMKSSVPQIRIIHANRKTVNNEGDFVLYWMTAYRRVNFNYSLQRAVEWAETLKKPLVILEALQCDYPWASDRIHGFILDGMRVNALQFKKHSVTYYPYIEPDKSRGKGLLAAMAGKSCVVITDFYPVFFLFRMIESVAKKIPVLMESVDSNGLLPLKSTGRIFETAYSFRRYLQKNLPARLFESPKDNPLKRAELPALKKLPEEITKNWPATPFRELSKNSGLLTTLPIDHRVAMAYQKGGSAEAFRLLRVFLDDRLEQYNEKRNQPEEQVTSGLSPYLHFGHISAHQVFHEISKKENWFFDLLPEKASGSKTGWWGMSEPAEAFLDQLITWRELGFNFCWQRQDYDQYGSLPGWAIRTLGEHEGDEREYLYSLKDFEQAATHDPLWNAAQTQLLREGGIHNYLRMLWGKKILEWAETPQTALEIMIELNNRYALDGRDPNSYSGIFWVLGRYDRPWGPEREVFGKIRYMSSKNTAKKVRVKDYIRKHTAE